LSDVAQTRQSFLHFFEPVDGQKKDWFSVYAQDESNDGGGGDDESDGGEDDLAENVLLSKGGIK
jgi:hypothetical protein